MFKNIVIFLVINDWWFKRTRKSKITANALANNHLNFMLRSKLYVNYFILTKFVYGFFFSWLFAECCCWRVSFLKSGNYHMWQNIERSKKLNRWMSSSVSRNRHSWCWNGWLWVNEGRRRAGPCGLADRGFQQPYFHPHPSFKRILYDLDR